MKNTQNITIGLLLVTAAILTGLAVLEESADAATPDRSGNYIVVTGSFSAASDMVYVINGAKKRLLAYYADRNAGGISLVAHLDLEKEFARAFPRGRGNK